jgi:hypothetical protein
VGSHQSLIASFEMQLFLERVLTLSVSLYGGALYPSHGYIPDYPFIADAFIST